MRDTRQAAVATLEEIASMLGVTKRAVHKTEQRALRKLRERLLADPEIKELLRESRYSV